MKCEICEQADAMFIDVLGEMALCETCLQSLLIAGCIEGHDVEDLSYEMLFLQQRIDDVSVCGSDWAV